MPHAPAPEAPGPADRPDLSGQLTGLLQLARDRHLDLKPVILRVQTDLFAAAPARDRTTVAAYESLALGLLPLVDDATAAAVARALAPVAEAPEPVLAALAARGGAARDAVVRGAVALSDAVAAAASADGTDLDPLVAARAGLASGTTRRLAALADSTVDLALAENRGIVLGGAALAALVSRARGEPVLARALLARPELSGTDLAPLYLHADATARARIRAATASLASLRHPPGPDVVEADPGPLLTALAARRDGEGFGAALADALRLPSLDLDLADPAHHDALALALRAAGVPEEDAVFTFLTLDPAIAGSVEAVFGLTALFRETRRATALDLVRAIQGAEEGDKARTEAPSSTRGGRGLERPDRGATERPARPAQNPAAQSERRRRAS